MNKLFILLLVIPMLFSCMRTRNLTESYVRKNIQSHEEGEITGLRLYSILKTLPSRDNSYIEMTGYQIGSEKGLIIGADKAFRARKKFENDNTIVIQVNYIRLSYAQCAEIMKNVNTMIQLLNNEKSIGLNEEVFKDYTISEHCFLSIRKGRYSNNTYSYFDLWMNNQKYKISALEFKRGIEKFLKWAESQ